MVSDTVEVTFDAAHMLSGYKGLCANLHGHTYKVQATIALDTAHFDCFQVNENCDGSNCGQDECMLMDFKDLKKIIQKEIKDAYDHSFIFWSNGSATELEIAHTLVRAGMRVVRLTHRPTAEVMARDIFRRLSAQVPLLTSVKLWETPTSFAEVTQDE